MLIWLRDESFLFFLQETLELQVAAAKADNERSLVQFQLEESASGTERLDALHRELEGQLVVSAEKLAAASAQWAAEKAASEAKLSRCDWEIQAARSDNEILKVGLPFCFLFWDAFMSGLDWTKLQTLQKSICTSLGQQFVGLKLCCGIHFYILDNPGAATRNNYIFLFRYSSNGCAMVEFHIVLHLPSILRKIKLDTEAGHVFIGMVKVNFARPDTSLMYVQLELDQTIKNAQEAQTAIRRLEADLAAGQMEAEALKSAVASASTGAVHHEEQASKLEQALLASEAQVHQLQASYSEKALQMEQALLASEAQVHQLQSSYSDKSLQLEQALLASEAQVRELQANSSELAEALSAATAESEKARNEAEELTTALNASYAHQVGTTKSFKRG